MTSLAVLGATGNLGGYVAREGVARGLDLSVVVRSPSRLSPDIATRARVTIGDLAQMPLDEIARFASGHDALICCAGLVSDGEKFVALADRVVCALETLAADKRPVAWFMAGAALLDFDARGRRGVDLPKVRNTYWPHSRNFARLGRSDLDWRLLCPGPMVEQSGLGAERLRVSFG